MKRLVIIATFLAAFLGFGCEGDYALYGGPGEIVYVDVLVPVPDGGGGDVWIDSFEQPYSVDGVDVLWIIDRSCSMNDNDPELLAGIEAMMNSLPASGWRLNMISATPHYARSIALFPLVPGDDIDDAIDLWNQVDNGGGEAGFLSAHEYIENNAYSSTWMRQDAALLVVFVSDEDEQSQIFPNPAVATIDEFSEWYDNLRSSVFLASIVHPGGPTECSSPPPPGSLGTKFIAATNYFNGVIVDICSDDWSAGVADASEMVEPYTGYPLTHTPIEDTLIVFIDFEESADWTYNIVTNSIEFTVVPPSGSLVEIGYNIDYFVGDDDDSAGN